MSPSSGSLKIYKKEGTMPRYKKFWSWTVFILGSMAYVPIMIGGWRHPKEINLASFSMWLIISGMLLYSSHSQKFAGWRIAFSFVVVNASLVILGLTRHGYTFNIGPAETIAFYGLIGTLSIWVGVGTITKR